MLSAMLIHLWPAPRVLCAVVCGGVCCFLGNVCGGDNTCKCNAEQYELCYGDGQKGCHPTSSYNSNPYVCSVSCIVTCTW